MSDEEEKKKVVQKRFGATVPGAWGTMCIRCDYSGKTHAAMMRAGIAANSTRAEQDRLRELKSKEMAKLKLFSQDDLDRLEGLVWENARRIYDFIKTTGQTRNIPYGYCLNLEYDYDKKCKHRDKNRCIYDCVTLAHRGLQRLLLDTKTNPTKKMHHQMEAFRTSGYAEAGIEICLKDKKGNKTNGITEPVGYMDKTLSDVVTEQISAVGSNEGYYLFGVSAMDAYHAITVVAKETQGSNNLQFNIFDQFGSFICNTLNGLNTETYRLGRNWYAAEDADESLLTYIRNIWLFAFDHNKKPKTTSILYQLKRKEP